MSFVKRASAQQRPHEQDASACSQYGQTSSWVTHCPVYACVFNSVRRLIQRIQMGITLKRETIMAWDALPVRMKLHTPAQHVLISKNTDTLVIVLSWDKNQTHWNMSLS